MFIRNIKIVAAFLIRQITCFIVFGTVFGGIVLIHRWVNGSLLTDSDDALVRGLCHFALGFAALVDVVVWAVFVLRDASDSIRDMLK